MTIKNLITDNLALWTNALETKSNAGRGSGGKVSLYGIKKLRELILELAVRGKLVGQDETDEPASELLKRIAEEKARLVKEKKIKKQEPLEEISEDEKPFELPKGWEWARLGECVDIIRGITFPSSEKFREPMEGKVACLRTTNVQHNIEWDDLLYIDTDYVKRNDQYLQLGDIVMSMANSRELVGKVAYVDSIPTTTCTFGGFLGVLRPRFISPSFVMSLLRTPFNRDSLIGSASQTTNIANISLEKLYPLVLAIPPLAEQSRIVAKVDELMALCDALESQSFSSLSAHRQLVTTLCETLTSSQSAEELSQNWSLVHDHFATLFSTEESIDQLKQTILQLAVMGKLVKQDDSDEPASVLLAKIAEEKARLVKEKKIKKQAPLPEISDDEKPFDLPKDWEWSNLQELFALVTDGDHQAPPKSETGIPFLVIGNVNTGNISFVDSRFVPLEYFEKLDWAKKPVKNDILYTVTGSYGITIKVTSNAQFCVQRHIAILKSTDQTPVDYLKFVLNSKFSYKYATNIATGIAQKTVPLSGLRNMPIPLPPLAEQSRIVAKVTALFSLCDRLKDGISGSKSVQKNLADALVGKVLGD